MEQGSYLTIPKGGIIFQQGEPRQTVYVIQSGRVRITAERCGQEVTLAEQGPGEVFGEMALIDDLPRTASATALEPCELLAMTKAQFIHRLERCDPALRVSVNVLLKRFRSTLGHLCDASRSGNEDLVVRQVLGMETNQNDHLAVLQEIAFEQEIKNALANSEFELHYQPIVRLDSRETAGFEALIRWNHPKRGLVPPLQFLPIAEAGGLIVDIGRWVLSEACAALARLQARTNQDLFISVNVSSRDIENPGFIEHLDKSLGQNDIRPDALKLEITESLLMQQPERAVEVLEDCRRRGLSIAIDDFGTGYSSLSYLHRFPIDMLKIDRSFVRDMESSPATRKIVTAIVGLAMQLNLPAVAEGIELEDQAKWLTGLGCRFGQGYLFAKPMPEEVALDYLRKDRLHPKPRMATV